MFGRIWLEPSTSRKGYPSLPWRFQLAGTIPLYRLRKNTKGNDPLETDMGEEEENHPSQALADCLLSQYRFCVGGVGLGAAYGIRSKKGAIPMVVGGVAGTLADFVYGYTVVCRDYVQDGRENGKGNER